MSADWWAWPAAVIVAPVAVGAVLNAILAVLLLGRYVWLCVVSWIERDLARAEKQARMEEQAARIGLPQLDPCMQAWLHSEAQARAAAVDGLPRWRREIGEIVEARWGNG